MENFDTKKYLEIALRRKYWIAIPFMVVLLVGFAYLLKTPRIYEAKTLILVQEQKVPEDYVRSIVSSDSQDRLRTITQQVTSRTNCEKIITDHQVYNDEPNMLMEDKYNLFVKSINIGVTGRSGREGNAFTITFQGKDPRKTMQVTNALASNFITENLKLRESQAIGTSSFLADELESVKKQLQEKEEQVKVYKEKYRGGLPEERDTNLRMLERLQLQLDQLNNNLRAAENRKLILQQGMSSGFGENLPVNNMLNLQQRTTNTLEGLKNELKNLKSKYTDNHPDIINLLNQIESIESQQGSSEGIVNNNSGENKEKPLLGKNSTNVQLDDVQLEISMLKSEIEKVSSKIKYYEVKLEETPKRELELVSLNRDYDRIRGLYNSMLDRKLESQIALSLERNQKGEQFKVIDQAQIPIKPVKPDVQKLLLIIISLGFGIGCGMAYLAESLDSSFRSPDDVEKDLGFSVLVCLPYLFTEQELRARKKRRIIIASSMIAGYCIAIVAVIIWIKGYSETVDFAREFLLKISIA